MGKLYSISLAVFVATGSFLFGYDSGVMTDVIASPNFLNFFNTTSTSAIIGAINSTFAGGACIGALQGGFTMDRFGRRLTIQLGGLICTIGAILQCAAQDLAMMLVGRILTGWAVGLLSMSVPVYQAECAHPKTRGLLVGLSQQMIGVGFIFSSWIGYGSAHAPASLSVQWRFPLAFQIVPAFMLMIGMIWLPETPRHLVQQERDEEAMRVLRKLHYDGTNDAWIQNEFTEIKATIQAENAVTAKGWLIMFKVPQWRTRLLQATFVQTFTQLTGINVIGYYQTIMYKALGITGHRNLLVAGIYNIMGPLANLIFITFIVDRIGRKKPLLFGTITITLALILEAIVNSQNPNGTREGLSIAGIAFLFSVTILFSFSFGPCSWLYMSEIMPMQIRGKGSAFATGVGNWAVSVLFSQISPIALGKIGWKYYFVFVAFNICVTFPTILFWFKETKGKTLEEIDLLFGERALGTLPDELTEKDLARPEVSYVEDKDA